MALNFPDAPDVQLMLRIQRGESRAFEELIDRHQKMLLNLVYRYVGDAQEAEDITQEVFMKVYSARKTYTPTAKVTTWLYRIAVNTCLNSLRNRKAHPSNPTSFEEADLWKAPHTARPDEKANEIELRSVVKSAVDGLPTNQRIAVILIKYENMSYEEAAKAMNMSVEAVKALLSRAKENLKSKLAPYVQ